MTAERVGGVVTLEISTGALSIGNEWETVDVCTLPWKPAFVVCFAVILQGGLSGVIGVIHEDGRLTIEGKNTQWRSGWLFGAASYACS